MRDRSSRLLILACSRSKRHASGLLPAIERYDGPTFRVLRRFLRRQPSIPLDVYIVSAELGLITLRHPIPEYDREMTPARANELQPTLTATFRRLLASRAYTQALVCAGRLYRNALGIDDVLPQQGIDVTIAAGSRGKMVANLHDWLYGDSISLARCPLTDRRPGAAILRGVTVNATADQVIEAARDGLADDPAGACRYHAWYVSVDNSRVAPKWLVGRLTGVSVRAFGTDQARRVLARLGVEVLRA
jgi:hypothetical protein